MTRPGTPNAARATDPADAQLGGPAGADSGGITAAVVPLAGLVPHPDNPRGADVGDVAELAASIREHGVLEPLVVVTAAAVAAAQPQLAAAVAGGAFVVVAGHRRRAGAAAAGLDRVPVVVRDDLAADSAGTVESMLVENMHRQALSPVEEARGFRRLAELGRSQRQIAARTGCAQSHVSKRLSLLRLPAEAVAAVESGRLPVAEAMELTRLHDHPDRVAALLAGASRRLAGRDPATGARVYQGLRYEVDRVLASIERERRAGQSRARVQAEGLELVDPAARWGYQDYRHRLRGQQDIARARNSGHLVAGVGYAGDVEYYTTKPPPGERRRHAEHRQAAADKRERRAAAKAREAACQQLAAGTPTQAQAVQILAGALLGGAYEHANPLRMAVGWLRAHGVGPAAGDHYDYERAVAGGGDPALRVRLACTLALAQAEQRARTTWRDWDAHDAAHVQRLVDQAGYQPTEWERGRLTTARAQATAAGGAAVPEPASAGGQPEEPVRGLDRPCELEDSCPLPGGHPGACQPTWDLGHRPVDGWVLYRGEDPYESTEDIDPDNLRAAQTWAGEWLQETTGSEPAGWRHDPRWDLHRALFAEPAAGGGAAGGPAAAGSPT